MQSGISRIATWRGTGLPAITKTSSPWRKKKSYKKEEQIPWGLVSPGALTQHATLHSHSKELLKAFTVIHIMGRISPLFTNLMRGSAHFKWSMKVGSDICHLRDGGLCQRLCIWEMKHKSGLFIFITLTFLKVITNLLIRLLLASGVLYQGEVLVK